MSTISYQPAGLWHDGGKEDDQAQLGEEEPVEDPPIVEPSEELIWKFPIYSGSDTFQYSEYFYELLVIMSSHLVLVHTIAPYTTILINIKDKG